ncbi:hypothetical protein VaNZ11_000776 [Volvox africanus]|uniref:Uncharacterized protein n=1 Tax=Volvox africanus TaxID=51714 RepID=A0ABQ5RPQ5_9CHLO|nr:hypothetical protein VaNZ11_000776 [Volvox africanus]
MHTSMRPLLNSGTSGSIAVHSAAGRSARRLILAPNPCTVPSTCPRSTQVLNPDDELTRKTVGAGSASASADDASTTAILASRGIERSLNNFDAAVLPQDSHILQDDGHFVRPPASQSDEPQPLASTSAPCVVTSSLPKRRRGRRAAAAGTGTLSSTGTSGQAGRAGNDGDSQDSPSHSPRTRDAAAVLASSTAPRPRLESPGTTLKHQARPRLRPPPPPLSWPDYPYIRHPVASACSPSDTTALKLEALFQCVLHYPRLPPKLLRFLHREVPDGPMGRLAEVTATVERLAEAVGREVAMYLIRRSSWLVLVPAESVAPRMEAVRRLLGLQPGGVPDLLRKNPNLLRMEEETLRGRYDALQNALYDAVGFDETKLRTLIVKYPLILNFKHESVHNALMALRRLCSARPDWVTYYKALSPSQVAFFIRERVMTLLRLEYLLLTGGGNGWTLRDVMKMSNNMFRKAYSGFRSWMQERMKRLQQRMAAARQAVEAQAAAQGRQLSREELERVAIQVQTQYARAEQERFHRQFMARREAERQDFDKRMEQRQRSIEEKVQKERDAELLAWQQRHGGQGAEGDEQEDEDGWQEKHRLYQQNQQQQRAGSSTGGGPAGLRTSGSLVAGAMLPAAADAAAAGRAPSSTPYPQSSSGSGSVRGSAGSMTGGPGRGSSARQDARQYEKTAVPLLQRQHPPPMSFSSADPLYRVTLGHVWQRPGSKVAPEPAPGQSLPQYQQWRQGTPQ